MTTRIGIDFGGTRIKFAEVSGAEVLRRVSIDTKAGASPAEIFDSMAEAVLSLCGAPNALGVAIPGEVDRDGRCVRLPNVPGFEGVAIAAELEARTGALVTVENDATTAAFGEHLYGWGRTYPSFLTVTLGTGIGGGLVIDGHLVRGAHGFAGEIGHATVDPSPAAPLCACGNRGCLETYAGTVGLLGRFREGGGEATEVKHIAESARRSERAGLDTFAMAADALAVGLSNIQSTLDLDAIVFSGGVSLSFDLVEPRLRAGLRARSFAPILAEVPLVVSALGELAGVVGAAHLPELRRRA